MVWNRTLLFIDATGIYIPLNKNQQHLNCCRQTSLCGSWTFSYQGLTLVLDQDVSCGGATVLGSALNFDLRLEKHLANWC